MDERLAATPPGDANDFLYQWESSRDYDPSGGLERIEAALLAINSADGACPCRIFSEAVALVAFAPEPVMPIRTDETLPPSFATTAATPTTA